MSILDKISEGASQLLVEVGIAIGLGVVGITMLWFIRGRSFAGAKVNPKVRSLATSAVNGECKMVILVRTDINMGRGKAAAQCCHAVLETYKKACSKYPQLVHQWEDAGQPKITLKVESEAELGELVINARKAGLPAESIRDAGRTQLAAGTRTCAAIGPGPAKMIDLITGHLKLY